MLHTNNLYLAESASDLIRSATGGARGKQDLGNGARHSDDDEFQFCRWWCGFSSVRSEVQLLPGPPAAAMAPVNFVNFASRNGAIAQLGER